MDLTTEAPLQLQHPVTQPGNEALHVVLGHHKVALIGGPKDPLGHIAQVRHRAQPVLKHRPHESPTAPTKEGRKEKGGK